MRREIALQRLPDIERRAAQAAVNVAHGLRYHDGSELSRRIERSWHWRRLRAAVARYQTCLYAIKYGDDSGEHLAAPAALRQESDHA